MEAITVRSYRSSSPRYERARQLSLCLRALAAQDYPRDRFEVLVVDDGSATSPEAEVGGISGSTERSASQAIAFGAGGCEELWSLPRTRLLSGVHR